MRILFRAFSCHRFRQITEVGPLRACLVKISARVIPLCPRCHLHSCLETSILKLHDLHDVRLLGMSFLVEWFVPLSNIFQRLDFLILLHIPWSCDVIPPTIFEQNKIIRSMFVGSFMLKVLHLFVNLLLSIDILHHNR